MNLAGLSIQRSRVTFVLLTVVALAGVGSYGGLARDSMPPYTVRIANIVTRFPGASPERVELLVTDRIEKVAQELPELAELTSTSRTGLSTVSVELRAQVSAEELQAVWDRLRLKLDAMQGLPAGVVPDLRDDGVGEVYGMAVALVSDGFTYAEMKDVADDLRNDLIRLPNAAKVEFGGVQDERVFIEYDNARLAEYGLSASQLQSVISATNIVGSGGAINLENERISLEPTGNFDDLAELGRLLVPVGSGAVTYLEDIADIRRGYVDPPSQIVRVNGRVAVALHVSLRENANVLALGEEIDAVVGEWNARLPVGLGVERIASLDDYIGVKVNGFVGNLGQSVAIVLLVMVIFLGLRTGLVIASLIPIVSLATLLLMGVMGQGLNQVTLAALIMALGMMVDNAIVVAEAVVVKREEGVGALEAAVDAAGELWAPLLISTATTSVAFLSFYLAESVMGDIVGPLFVVISLALGSSWLVSLTITTLFCYLFLTVGAADDDPSFIDRLIERLRVWYRDVILWGLVRRGLVIAGVGAAFVLALLGFRFIPFVFFPDSDRNLVTVDINLPLGTRIEETSRLVAGFEAFLRDSLQVDDPGTPGVRDWSAFVGAGPESYDLGYLPDEPNSSYAHMLVNTTSFGDNAYVMSRLYEYGFLQHPDAEIAVAALSAGGGGLPIEIRVAGRDPDVLAGLANEIKLRLHAVEGTRNVKDDWGPRSKKFIVDIDQARAQAAGVSSQDIATSLQTVLEGFRAGEFREGDSSIPILIRTQGSQQQTLSAIETVDVFSQRTGARVPLLQVAGIVPEWQFSRIRRRDLERTVTISSDLDATGNANVVMAEMTPWLDDQAASWPTGYGWSLGGEAQRTAENMGAVVAYLPLSGLIILLLLVLQFNSIRKTTIVIATVPLALIGVVIGLLVFGEPFGFMPFLGVISLAGIIINNAIVLIDRIDIELSGGKRAQDAILDACLQRFRPILLATFTTVFGLVPLYLSGGEMWEGMAIGIMCGLLFGTIITLLFVPCLYSLLFGVRYDAGATAA